MAKDKQLANNKEKVNDKPAPKPPKKRVRCTWNPFFYRINEGNIKMIVECEGGEDAETKPIRYY